LQAVAAAEHLAAVGVLVVIGLAQELLGVEQVPKQFKH